MSTFVRSSEAATTTAISEAIRSCSRRPSATTARSKWVRSRSSSRAKSPSVAGVSGGRFSPGIGTVGCSPGVGSVNGWLRTTA